MSCGVGVDPGAVSGAAAIENSGTSWQSDEALLRAWVKSARPSPSSTCSWMVPSAMAKVAGRRRASAA